MAEEPTVPNVSIAKVSTRLRGYHKGRLTMLQKALQGCSSVKTAEHYIEVAKDALANVERIHWELEGDDVDDDYLLEAAELANTIISKAYQCIESVSQNQRPDESAACTTANEEVSSDRTPSDEAIRSIANRSNVASKAVRLPTIPLAVFDGTAGKWVEFRDSFQSIIGNDPDVDALTKMKYLKQCLKGAAAGVIASMPTNSVNYESSWQMLEERFENKRLQVRGIVNTLFTLPSLTREGDYRLREIADGAMACVHALENLGFEQNPSRDVLLISIVVEKLDARSVVDWEATLRPNEIPTFRELYRYLTSRCNALDSGIANHTPKTALPKAAPPRGVIQRCHAVTRTYDESERMCCVYCKGKHEVSKCERFLRMTVAQRVESVKENNLCFMCLKHGHHVNGCRSSKCARCNRRHHELMHYEVEQSNVALTMSVCAADGWLTTATIELRNDNGEQFKCRALLDSGANTCLMSKKLADRFGYAPTKFDGVVGAVGNSELKCNSYLQVSVFSRGGSQVADKVRFLILDGLVGQLPAREVPFCRQISRKLFLADPAYNKPAQVDCILGSNVFWNVLQVGKVTYEDGTTLMKTSLGWIICSREWSCGRPMWKVNHSMCKLEESVAKFWAIEETPPLKPLPEKDQRLEAWFQENVHRDEQGRFTVKLPLKSNRRLSEIGSTRPQAVARLRQMERRFKSQPELRDAYICFMREYEEQGHMVRLPNNVEAAGGCYLPHHAVVKAESITSKTRVVFDASSSSSSGVSLNDVLEVGPTLQDNLFDVVLRFRTHAIVLVADIAKMYRQIRINASQQNLQRIVWREDERTEPIDYALRTLTYGTAPASYLAVRCLLKLADDGAEKYPRAAAAVRRDFYMDDVLSGAPNTEDATQLRDELLELLSSGGLQLRKWLSNDPSILIGLPTEDNFVLPLGERSDAAVKTLGLRWRVNGDEYEYQVPTVKGGRFTKRSILAEVARIFDPLGLLAPIIIIGKIIMQALWSRKLEWDETVPADIYHEWTRFQDEMPAIKNIRVSRQVCDRVRESVLELHGFCDASQSAFAACIYVLDAERRTCKLACSKTKVAPLKTLSIPRLELCAAVLLSRLMQKTIVAMGIEVSSVRCWSDSMVVLAWLAREPSQWNTFVANRVSEVQRGITASLWAHVPTADNPADIASRGMLAKGLEKCSLWWHGPSWLTSARDCWPDNTGIIETSEEIKHAKNVNTAQLQTDSWFEDLSRRFSKLSRLVRVMAWVRRFVKNARKAGENLKGRLSASESRESETWLVKRLQGEQFRELINALSCGEPGRVCVRWSALNPFLSDGLVRVGGRLRNSKLSINARCPILLPRSHRITELIIVREHEKAMHSGTSMTLACIRQQYWIVNGRDVVSRVLRKCVRCVRHRPRLLQPPTGDLPKHRVEAADCFSNVGVDFCGPLSVKEGGRRSTKLRKAYVCVFVCMCTKAVHLEMVSELSTAAFLATLDRFTSRRGNPTHVYSDNGRNFLGAARELKKMATSVPIGEWAAQRNITWHFIPPYSPHFGGLWEAAVKSMKTCMQRVTGEAKLTFEEAATLVVRIEGILNSRPLVPLSSDPNDIEPLTPGHFLIGRTIVATAERDYTAARSNVLSRWEYLKKLRQDFWRRWKTEYLSSLQQRPKHGGRAHQIDVGDLVVLKDTTEPLHWPMARVIKVKPGKDGVVRVAELKTARGVCERATKNICKLPI